MITDHGFKLWEAESIILTSGSSKYTSSVDMGVLDAKNWDQTYELIFFHVVMAEDLLGGYADFQLQTSPDNSTWTTILRTFDSFALLPSYCIPRCVQTKATKGTVFPLVKQRPKMARYVRLGVTAKEADITQGKVTATLVLDAQTAGRR